MIKYAKDKHMTYDKLKVGILLTRKNELKTSYLVYEKTDKNVSLFEITRKKKYLPWDKIYRSDWEQSGLWASLKISKNRFDMHDAIKVVFEKIRKLEK